MLGWATINKSGEEEKTFSAILMNPLLLFPINGPENYYIGEQAKFCERDYMLSEPPWLALFLSLIGHSKQLKQLCTYLIG